MTEFIQDYDGDDEPSGEPNPDRSAAAIDRILRRGERAAALGADETHTHSVDDGDQQELADRQALRRVKGLSTELEDVTEVEYRQLRLEKVVLIGIWTGDVKDAEYSMRELAALALSLIHI
jgi:GTP-binding protein HflX